MTFERKGGAMVPATSTAIDDELRGILESLTEGMFPLGAWVENKIQAGEYKPREHVPWRDKGQSLSTKSLGAVTFFEELLERSVDEAPLVERWSQVTIDPLAFSPMLEGAAGWRASRNLDPAPQFGIMASQNALARPDGAPSTRADFYALFWPLLRQAVHDADPKSPGDWEALAKDLINDASSHWPAQQTLKSSSFIKQFGRDILQALLNMRNPAPDPWRVAFLVELGEHRRVGNSYTRDDVERFVRAFRARINTA